jgi:endo-1,4-beta-xylanase
MANYKSNLDAFVNLGVDVAYTELDIRMTLPSDQQKLNQQATDYGNVVSACAKTPRCVGVTTWGLSDAHSWVGGTFRGTGDALPWSSSFQKKPAYYAILYAFGNGTMAAPGGATSTIGVAT